MSERNTVIRAMHDLGGAAWFGGSLMGAVGLNGAASDVADPAERSRVAAAGWARWAPVNAVAIGAHLVGGLGLVLVNRGRLAGQKGATANTVVKAALTAAAVGATAYSGTLGAKVAQAGQTPAAGATTPAGSTPEAVAQAQKQLAVTQWAIPVLTGAIMVLGSQQGEQQRPADLLRGLADRLV
ncbi:hypothetical protein [Rhodococcus sp. X156]|uniref:hypothetical protein n=1 Tax=Rhodococcus sp. X156 TaxID=2499145 RepID=UPI000FD9A619|nr:hypothetical protein [Rhodococcus sp. X156]